MQSIRSVDEYILQHEEWSEALRKLRKVLNATELAETIKWGAPCYTIDGKNVVGLGAFSNYVGLWFFQGVFLSDSEGVLINAQEGTTKAMRQWRFASLREINTRKIKPYILEAIGNQKQGKTLKPDRSKALVLPPELAKALKKRPKARRAYDDLTPGKQREYAEYIASAKQDKTKASRLEKILPMIEAGSGLHDKYRKC